MNPQTSSDGGELIAPGTLDELVERGFVHLPRLVGADELPVLRAAIDRLAATELEHHGAAPTPNNGYYVRELIWKDRAFHPFIRREPLISLAREVLGSRLRVDINARVAFEDEVGANLSWHIHTPGPKPRPPWSCDPHTVACLVYLDDVGPTEGALQMLPGTHRRTDLSERDAAELARATTPVELYPHAGDCVVMHGNLWHATIPSSAGCTRRRILFVGYGAAWLELGATVPGQPADLPRPISEISWPEGDRPDPQEEQDLLGGFRW